MSTAKVIDNKRVLLRDVLLEISQEYNSVSIAVGYWDLPGLQLLWENLRNYKKVRLLIGREPLLSRDNVKGIQHPEPNYPDEDFFKDLRKVQFSEKTQNLVKELKSKIDKGEFEVRVYRKDFLHAKAYIFGDYSSNKATAITGSSNFTRAGLTTNTELNTAIDDHRIVLFKPKNDTQEHGYLSWFDELWNDKETEEWSGEFVELVRTSPTGDLLFSPYELYIRSVYEVYRRIFEADETEITHTHTYKLKDFQERNVKNLVHILKEYGVAMLADSVGLGKTVSALGVIKQYGSGARVIVIAPASLTKQWKQELAKEKIMNAVVLSLQNKNEIEEQMKLDKYVPVSLFVIDESHNLRNSNSTRYELIFDWIANERNEEADTLLLTATPINNNLSDLVNQILLGARGDQDIFILPTEDKNSGEIVLRSFYEIIENTNKQLNQNKKRLLEKGASEEEIRDRLYEIYEKARLVIDPVIRAFVIRNTRQSIKALGGDIEFPEITIENTPYKLPDLSSISFPEKVREVAKYSMDSLRDTMDKALHPMRQIREGNVKYADEQGERKTMLDIYKIVLSLGLIPYRWRMYEGKIYGKTRKEAMEIVSDKENSEKRGSLTRQWSMYGMIRTQLLKRLESSPYALKKSVERYLHKLSIFQKYLSKKDLIISLSDIPELVSDFKDDDGSISEISDEDLEKYLEEKKRENIVEKASSFYRTEEMLEDIEEEKELIRELIEVIDQLIERDEKVKSLEEALLNSHTQHPERKIIVFTSFAETIDYLKEKISLNPKFSELAGKMEFVSGRDKNAALRAADRFSPIARGYTPRDIPGETELTYLFSTDVLSEGQNLQDAQAIINYDLHWNPVRMIQRNGRINRIGSKHREIFVYNYVPSEELESLLGLVETIRQKIELMRITVGTDTQVLDEEIDPRAYLGIYSQDARRATEEYLKMEEEMENLTDEVFINDVRDFLNNSSEKQIRKVLRISNNSWTKGKFQVDSQSFITLSKVHYEEGESLTRRNKQKGNHIFFEIKIDDRDPYVARMIQSLALQKIREGAINERTKPENDISEEERKKFEQMFTRFARDAAEEPERLENLTPTKMKVMDLAKKFDFTHEESELLEKLLTTRNIPLQRKMNRIVRRINRNEREGRNLELKHDFEEIRQLVERVKRGGNRMRVRGVEKMFIFKQK